MLCVLLDELAAPQSLPVRLHNFEPIPSFVGDAVSSSNRPVVTIPHQLSAAPSTARQWRKHLPTREGRGHDGFVDSVGSCGGRSSRYAVMPKSVPVSAGNEDEHIEDERRSNRRASTSAKSG